MPYPDLNDPTTQPLGSVEGSAAYSPMTLLMRFFQSKGLTPNAQMIRDALTQNAREPGYIPGLRNPEAEDSSPRVQSTRVGAGGGGQALPVPPVPPADGAGTPTTSAAPTDGPAINISSPTAGGIAQAIALGLGGLAAGRYGASRMGPQPGESVPSEVFRPPAVATQQAAGGAPTVTPTPGAGEPPLVPQTQNPLDTALNRATEVYGPPETTLPGVERVDPDLLGNRRPGPSTPVENRPLPFSSPSPRVAPTAEDQAVVDRARELNIPRVTPGPVSKTERDQAAGRVREQARGRGRGRAPRG